MVFIYMSILKKHIGYNLPLVANYNRYVITCFDHEA